MPIPSPLLPASQQAQGIYDLFEFVLVITSAILLIVAGLVFYCVIRFRRRPGDGWPKQDFGNQRLEIFWTVIPLLIVTAMFFLTVQTMNRVHPQPLGQKPELEIVAHQWWWEARYPDSGVVTANEIHIPVKKNILYRLTSADVIHDFWVPQLGQKIDAIPNHPNFSWISADAPGTYLGTCAEYCGAEHAWMRIRVIAQTPKDFADWIAHQQQPPPTLSSPLAIAGRGLFLGLPCMNCHTIAGTSAKGTVGPNLTHVASRETLAAGVLKNTPANIARWISNPQKIKPGCHMPNLLLKKNEVEVISAYLEELK
jgi:cytochrome c oxidase subunit 2